MSKRVTILGIDRPYKWTEREDEFLRENMGRMTLDAMAGALRRRPGGVKARLTKIGMDRLRYVRPSSEICHAAARVAASVVGIDNYLMIFGASRKREIAYARWVAWSLVRDASPRYSLAGIGRAFGRDHTSLIHAFKAMEDGRFDNALAVARVAFHRETLPPDYAERVARLQESATAQGVM